MPASRRLARGVQCVAWSPASVCIDRHHAFGPISAAASCLHFFSAMPPDKKIVPPDKRRRPKLMRLGGVPKRPAIGRGLERFSRALTDWVGTSWAFGVAFLVVLVWACTGPLFHFSDTWQLVINTGTTIVTFLMVFLIQRAQNNDARAIHLKLNEIIAAVQGASNRIINVEDLTEDEVRTLHRRYARLVALARETGELTESHSVEEATARHARDLLQREEKSAS
jgi:low affinity Fe/Cu permease